VTSGVVALMLEAHNRAFDTPPAPNAVKAMLEYSAILLANYDRLTQGSGEINADGAIQLGSSIDASRPLMDWWLASPVSQTTTIAGDAYQWGQTVVWGNTAVVWGVSGNSVWDDPNTWATTVVWGNSLLSANGAP
jgi:hypothetical protein